MEHWTGQELAHDITQVRLNGLTNYITIKMIATSNLKTLLAEGYQTI